GAAPGVECFVGGPRTDPRPGLVWPRVVARRARADTRIAHRRDASLGRGGRAFRRGGRARLLRRTHRFLGLSDRVRRRGCRRVRGRAVAPDGGGGEMTENEGRGL